MSNLSLKEQLQAIASELPTRVEAKKASFVKNKTTQPSLPSQKKAQENSARPAWLEQARYGVELLKVHYPACFKEQAVMIPLKVGIRQDLIKHLGGRTDIALADKACMSSSLSYYVNSPGYHRRVVEGAVRVDLNGEPAGVVTAEEANYSQSRKKVKHNKDNRSI